MRPTILNPLFAAVAGLPGVGPGAVRLLARLKITRLVDLIFHLPVMFVERLAVRALDPTLEGRTVTIAVTVVEHQPAAGRAPTRVRVEDAFGNGFSLVWFGGAGRRAAAELPVGAKRTVSGRLERYGERLQIAHPDWVVAEGAAVPEREPVYPLTAGLTNRRMGVIAAAAVARAPELAEWAAPPVAEFGGWPRWRDALVGAHAMEGPSLARLAYDELFAGQLALLLVRASTKRRRTRALAGDGLRARLLARLPYAPTGAQASAMAEIAADMALDEPMLRLLQGDVGAGKTLVAAHAVAGAIEAGAQAAVLAPTELLARQHGATLGALFTPLGVRVDVLTGRDGAVSRQTTGQALADGRAQLVVGTHALFQEAVRYRALGLVVVDEQHRFGVQERKAMTDKGFCGGRPHVLAMSATPIPRTLTLTQYGEMDVSRLDELPPGRTPVATSVVSLERLDEVLDALGRHLAAGEQAYWVCPLVAGVEGDDEAAAEARAAGLGARFGAERVALVHGRLRGAEKAAAMARFAGGAARLLVATTVIEVGVDVPAATLIVIEAAERFGLAQLHQLRGRVGRGGGVSRCVLLRGAELSETARARLALLKRCSDGFVIAEEDLRLRGAGEMLGTRQSGEAAFRLARAEHVAVLTEAARADAAGLLAEDPELVGARGVAARVALYLFERDAAVRLLVSG